MKNIISYYYNIVITEFKVKGNIFTLLSNNIEYLFVPFYFDINEVINLYSLLRNYRKEVNEIMINKDNNIVTYYENQPYILIKKIYKDNKEIELNDIINYNLTLYINNKLNWKKLWQDKVDYYEIQLRENNLEYPIIKQSFNYYIGLSECAISLLNFVNENNIIYSISHKRLEKKDDLYNPLNIIIDSRIRDIAEYIKKVFFNESINKEQIYEVLNKSELQNDEAILLISRLVYPSYYFDFYEKIYTKVKKEKELYKIIKKNAEYEAFLKEFYKFIKQKYNIPVIEFLEF